MSGTVESAVEGFLAHKRALGRKYDSEERELRLLARFAAEQRIGCLDGLTPALVDDFLASRPRSRPRSFNHLLGVVRGLLGWAVTQELLGASPLQARPRRVTSIRVPFLFDAVPGSPAARCRGRAPGQSAGPAAGPDLPCDLRAVLRARVASRGGVRAAPRRHRHRPAAARRAGRQVRQEPPGPARAAHRRARRLSRPSAAGPTARRARRAAVQLRRHSVRHPCTASQTSTGWSPTSASRSRAVSRRPSCTACATRFAVGCLLRWYREGLDPQAGSTGCPPSWATSTLSPPPST